MDDVVTSMDRDLVVYIKIAEPHQPRIIQEVSRRIIRIKKKNGFDLTVSNQKSPNGTAAMMLSLVPSFKLAEQKTELIFLVDRSGSMEGQGIEQAKQALKVSCIRLYTHKRTL